MRGAHRHAALSQSGGEFLGDGDRTMATSRTSERDGEIGAALGLVLRHEARQEFVELVDEGGADGSLEDEITHLRVVPGQRAQVVLPVRIREEPQVHHDVGVERESVLEAEALDGDLQS